MHPPGNKPEHLKDWLEDHNYVYLSLWSEIYVCVIMYPSSWSLLRPWSSVTAAPHNFIPVTMHVWVASRSYLRTFKIAAAFQRARFAIQQQNCTLQCPYHWCMSCYGRPTSTATIRRCTRQENLSALFHFLVSPIHLVWKHERQYLGLVLALHADNLCASIAALAVLTSKTQLQVRWLSNATPGIGSLRI